MLRSKNLCTVLFGSAISFLINLMKRDACWFQLEVASQTPTVERPKNLMNRDTIAILDDEPDRLRAMEPILAKRYPQYNVVTFDNAPDINAWFEANLPSCILICLDHDLGPTRKRDGADFDPGIGRDVSDYLASRDPICPVIIHTTNTDARPGMIFGLEDAGWIVSYVSPYSDVLWVREVWADEVRSVLS